MRTRVLRIRQLRIRCGDSWLKAQEGDKYQGAENGERRENGLLISASFCLFLDSRDPLTHAHGKNPAS